MLCILLNLAQEKTLRNAHDMNILVIIVTVFQGISLMNGEVTDISIIVVLCLISFDLLNLDDDDFVDDDNERE